MPAQTNQPLADAASDIFLHVQTRRAGKIKGEGTTDGHRDDIGVHGWSWGVDANTAIGSSASTARRSYRQLVVTKSIDSASTGLLSALVTNDEVREATLAMRKAGGEALDYYTMTLARARVVSIDLGVDENGEPTETVGFAYTKIDVEYKRQEGSGQSGTSTSFSDEVLAA